MVSKQSKSLIYRHGYSWWFVFKDLDKPILRRVLKKGYQHVFAVTRMNDLVLGLDPMMGQAVVMLTDTEIVDLLVEYKKQGFKIVHLRKITDAHKFTIRAPFVTCASYLAYTTGIPFVGITPWQLYKKLMRIGGEVV